VSIARREWQVHGNGGQRWDNLNRPPGAFRLNQNARRAL